MKPVGSMKPHWEQSRALLCLYHCREPQTDCRMFQNVSASWGWCILVPSSTLIWGQRNYPVSHTLLPCFLRIDHFLTQTENLCLLIRLFNPIIFNVINNVVGFMCVIFTFCILYIGCLFVPVFFLYCFLLRKLNIF